jgi:hypothetical protein
MVKTLWLLLNRRVQWPNRFLQWLKSIDSLMLALATIALAWIAFWQWTALDKTDTTLRSTLVASNRAWIKQSGINVTGDINGQGDLKVEVYYANVGKSPAININQSFFAGAVPVQDVSNLRIEVGPNHTCDDLAPDRSGRATFPDPSGREWVVTVIYISLILPYVPTNHGALFLQGCFVYETMGEIHKTWFCDVAYINGILSTTSQTPDCKDGHGAN